ncbi:TonB-dependent siderophore receptor [Vreelandella olivaria]|uniref:TonB-dependent siderophore receptor n=1 Tax=Vreelandella olivaria TaxID=390919 RepID=UPI00201ECA41|nr:TonB-dependent siderophore receptor [Halomonas olivaria]
MIFRSHYHTPRYKVLPLCLLLAGSSTTASPLFAQTQSDDDIELSPLTVNAYRAADTISAATKTDTPLVETPQSVTVIERNELDARGVQNLNEAARYTAGVLPESQGIDNRVDDLYIRGFDAGSFSNNVTLDGLRIPSNGSNSWNRAAFNTWNLERVEVLKGPSSVLYGQIAPGGMVNQVSKVPTLDQAQQLRLQLDEHGRYQSAFDVGGANGSERARWRLVGLFSDGDTQIDETSYQHWFLAPSATFTFNDDTTQLTLLGTYQENDGGSTFQFLPYQGTVVPAADGYIDNTTFLGEPGWNTYDRTLWTAGWQLEHMLNERWKLDQNARYTHVDSLYQASVGNGVRGAPLTELNTLGDGRILARRAVQGEGEAKGYSIDTRLEGEIETGDVVHRVLAGVDWQKSDWSFFRQAASVDPNAIAIDVYNPVYTHFDFAPTLVAQTSTEETDEQRGIYLQNQLAWNQWRLTIGGRYDWFEIDSLNRLTDTRSVTDDQAFTARAGLAYLFNNGFAPYVSYAESFQPATGTTRDGNTFEPTIGTQWEVGVKYEPRNIDGMITLSAYDLRQQNVLTADPRNDADESFQVQTGEVQIRGIELEGRVTPTPGFSVIGALTRFDSEVTRNNDGYQGNRMSRVPDWMGSLWLDYSFWGGPLNGLSVAAGARYVDETYGDLGNYLHIPDYTLYDAAIRYDVGRVGNTNLELSLNASNLTDERYVATCNAATSCYYGSGRTVTASVNLYW